MSERPLAGRTILVTRASAQAAKLAEPLIARGAEVVCTPVLHFGEPADPLPLRDAVTRIGDFDWVVLTSANGAAALLRELARQRTPVASALAGVRIACVGPATAAALRDHGIANVTLPARFTGQAVAESIAPALRPGTRVLLPRADAGNPDLPAALVRAGAHVTEVVSYRTLPDEEGIAAALQAIATGSVDLVTFTAPSAAAYVLARRHAPFPMPVAAIGPVTAARLAELGVTADVVAEEQSSEGLAEAIARFFAGAPRAPRH